MFETIDQGLQFFKEEIRNYVIKSRKNFGNKDKGWIEKKDEEWQKLNGMAAALGLSREEAGGIWFNIEKDIDIPNHQKG